jgi:hypothetical protein
MKAIKRILAVMTFIVLLGTSAVVTTDKTESAAPVTMYSVQDPGGGVGN